MKSINEQLRHWRLSQGLSGATVAARLGVDRSSITKWELETRKPRIGYEAWAEALGCTVRTIVTAPGIAEMGELSDSDQAIVQQMIAALPRMTGREKGTISSTLKLLSAED